MSNVTDDAQDISAQIERVRVIERERAADHIRSTHSYHTEDLCRTLVQRALSSSSISFEDAMQGMIETSLRMGTSDQEHRALLAVASALRSHRK